MTRGNLKQLSVILGLFVLCPELYEAESDFGKVKNPCAITRNIKNNLVIRVVDEVNDEPGVILGDKGLLYYTLIASRIHREVVIECCSSHAPVKWVYKGVGASSGFKIVNTRWSGSDINRAPACYSSAIVISHVTDQLTGEYKCLEVNSTRSKGPRRNSFKLFVPSTPPNYPEQGSEVNVTVSNGQDKIGSKPLVVLPCISKKVNGEVMLYSVDDKTEPIQPVTYKNMRYDPFTGFIIPQSSLLFGNSSRVLSHECKFAGSNATLLTVNLVLESEEKIAPEKDVVKSSAPYLSWTTKQNPKLKFTPDIQSNVLIWQQFFTKKGFEEISSDAPMFYLGSATLVNLTRGSEGKVELYEGGKWPEDGLIRKWEYFVLDVMAEQNAGLKYEEYEYDVRVFVCKSASPSKPEISFREVLQDGSIVSTNNSGTYNITKCPELRGYGHVGCVMLTSYVSQGEVRCVGDGVDETVRFPPVHFEAGRPFFVERGANLVVTLSPDADKLRIPCLTNYEVAPSVFLFKKNTDGYKKIWSEDEEEFGDSDIEFYPSTGFHLTQENSGELHDLFGTYLCSSSADPNDMTDSLVVEVRKEIGTNFKIHPSEERVYARITVKFSWEADEELEVVSANPLRNISLGREENDPKYGFGGKSVIIENTPEGETRNVSLRRKSDGVVLHNWVFQQIDRNAEHRAGLFVEMKEDGKGEHFIVVTCRSKTDFGPKIRYYHCLNNDTCDLMRRCHQKDCHNPTFQHEETVYPNIVEDCDSGKGCSSIVFRSMYLNGILNISCVGDGVNEHRLVKDVFFKEDIVWDTDKEDAYVYMSTSHAVHAADQNPQREIQYIGSNVEWDLGETVEFSCVAAPFLYSNGIKWAVTNKKGKMMFQRDSVFDLQFKYTGHGLVASTFSLLIDRLDYSRVYCFVPKLGSTNEWHNASMPIFIRSETSDDYCHEANSIHLINVYPTPSKLNLDINETRLDKLPYFVVPDNVLQFAVKISGPKPFTWIFSGDGPSRTPLIQSDRKIVDFYDSSTYCYSSRLLLNLRHKNPNDTGRYTVKYKYESKEIASFYIFVPSKSAPYLLRSGSTVNITIPEDDDAFYIPCLVNNPDVNVELKRIDTVRKLFYEQSISNEPTSSTYDPTRGFLMSKDNGSADKTIIYKCTANKNQTDSVVVYVNPPQRSAQLKFEKVNDFYIFKCISSSKNPPVITLTEIGNDGAPVENSTVHKTTRCSAGCVALITQVKQGSVSCVGDGIDETYRFPPNYNANKRNSDKSVGLWFDNTTSSFKCQMNSVEPPTLAAVTCRRPNECEIMKRLLQGRGDESQATYSHCGEGCAELQVRTSELSYTAPNWFSIFLRCRGEDSMEILSQYFYDRGTMTYASIENAEKLKKIRIDVPALRRQGKMVFATFRCFANRYFYSRGYQWGLESKTGILEFPATSASQVEVQHFSAVMSTINLEIDEDIHTAVYCFVPLLDTPGAWANSTMKFPIEQLQVHI